MVCCMKLEMVYTKLDLDMAFQSHLKNNDQFWNFLAVEKHLHITVFMKDLNLIL